ncbi:MAG: Response sensor protein [Chitinophagaceae bacterium]|nr:Response sensor protein [Chitinophagaceae bacterium]MDB5223808.1 Response sensor protein [Chitinophagaceae bacterium]
MDTLEDLARLSAIVLSSEDAIISKNLNGTITSWNPAAETIFGYTAEEAVGKNISLIIPDELITEEHTIISKIKKGEKINHYETVRRKKDGTRFLAAITISPIKDNKENIIGASKIARDITALKSAEQKQAMLAAIIDSSDDAIVSKGLDGIIASWNHGAEKIFGYDQTEAIGKHISIIIPGDRLSEETEIINKIRKGERISHFETIRRTKDGREVNISLTVSPVKDKNGKVIGASKVARDITEKAEIEKQRQLFTERLQELNHYKDEFMAMASHELKTPLTVIKANLQILEHKMHGDTNIDFVNKTLNQVNRLTNLISDLLDVSKIQTGALELNRTNFDLTPFLEDVIENIQQTSTNHQLILNANNKKLMVRADRDRLEQVVINILTNAIKYSPNGKKVTIDTSIKNKEILISVTDHGIGIPEDDLDKVFTRFFRVRGLASTFSGSGIGLYISSEIIKRHGGSMWVESEIDKGSAFYFTIPSANS